MKLKTIPANTETHSMNQSEIPVPAYLSETYWWAYLHPRAVRFFERQWLVNLILFGNYKRLCSEVIAEFGQDPEGASLQIACVYGDLTQHLARCHQHSGALDILDVAPIQLENLKNKLVPQDNVALIHQDACSTGLPSDAYQRTLLFFLLHEMPWQERVATLHEAIRVTRPGGKLIIIDYHRPDKRSPMYYFLAPILKKLEPYAMDLWQHDIENWLPSSIPLENVSKQTFFAGLYQKLVITLPG